MLAHKQNSWLETLIPGTSPNERGKRDIRHHLQAKGTALDPHGTDLSSPGATFSSQIGLNSVRNLPAFAQLALTKLDFHHPGFTFGLEFDPTKIELPNKPWSRTAYDRVPGSGASTERISDR